MYVWPVRALAEMYVCRVRMYVCPVRALADMYVCPVRVYVCPVRVSGGHVCVSRPHVYVSRTRQWDVYM